MQDPLITLTLAVAALTGLAIVAVTALRGWNGWLDLKRAELARGSDDAAPPSTATRIEVADLKERIRKLEAIAAGVDL
ncbi:hypothetical protein M527_11170 [Sphingobium indicum IP26]|uniref:Uncharacterized protein n=1 Tax=Sphingobium indicum F2 TaxID=1450518 RepID=A0A8E0WSD2_9SPHN|nr:MULTISPECIES: hypothetical protein [Sphingobium]EPR18720.1 hypothetical protein M527_11170 [Sphingobium indicum IP26]EQB00395.1 hypothetical protein L286_18080 [Sphingobium sp. HDIP04]KER36043.1 hypothetical protein AL00_12365 [Sphingobium indicum F2]